MTGDRDADRWGEMTRDASGRLGYEVDGFPASAYHELRKVVAREFRLWRWSLGLATPDEIFVTYRRGRAKIGFEWDHWTGLWIVAKNRRGERLVEEIATFLQGHPRFREVVIEEGERRRAERKRLFPDGSAGREGTEE